MAQLKVRMNRSSVDGAMFAFAASDVEVVGGFMPRPVETGPGQATAAKSALRGTLWKGGADVGGTELSAGRSRVNLGIGRVAG